jgi:hypothetical protein
MGRFVHVRPAVTRIGDEEDRRLGLLALLLVFGLQHEAAGRGGIGDGLAVDDDRVGCL